MTTVLRNLVVVGLTGLLAACAGSSARTDRLPVVLPVPGDRVVGERLIDAQYVVAGRLEKLERANRYEPHGGWLARLLFHDDGPPDAYEARIQVDSVLKGGGQPKRLYVTFFAPPGNRIPAVGLSAIWIAHRRQLWRFADASMYGTPYDIGLALDSDDDIRPPGDWPWLRTLAQKLALSDIW